jgi:hypothetical protein
MKRFPSMFPIYFAGNIALVIIGYEAATVQALPRWVVLLGALAASAGLAYQAASALARSYAREDRASSLNARLLR